MQITNKKFRLRSGANWTSFEKFRLQGAEALSSIANGVYRQSIYSIATKKKVDKVLVFRELLLRSRDFSRWAENSDF